ncbi:hypothetical protein [Streptomyces sp. NPDC003635]
MSVGWTRRRAVAALAVAAAVPLLGGCGIQDTDVVEAGGPASFQAFLDRDRDMLLFFRSPDGRVVPVIRSTGPSTVLTEGDEVEVSDEPTGPVPTEKVISALFVGPRDEDLAAGLRTDLPVAGRHPSIEVDRAPSGKVVARLPLAVKGLSDTARRQLICTIAYGEDADGRLVVELTGSDGATSSGTCGLARPVQGTG